MTHSTQARAMELTALSMLLNLGYVPAAFAIGETSRISLSSSGQEGDLTSRFQSLSADGRYVAFWSGATNLVKGDTNKQPDIFLRDRQTGKTKRINVSADGQQANGASYGPLISANGRYIAFSSQAKNLVPGDTNNWSDAFLHDRLTGKIERVSVDANGQQAKGGSYPNAVSANGRFVTFASDAANLVADDTNGWADMFLRDRVTGKIERVSVASGGQQADKGSWYQGGAVSDDGRYVTFYSESTNLASDDTNGKTDVYIRDRRNNTTTRISVASNGQQGDDESNFGAMSSGGRYVAFISKATNLVPGDTNQQTDIFVRDQVKNITTRISVASNGQQGDRDSSYPSISADGRFISFYSDASNLIAGDSNGSTDAFVHDRVTGKTTRVSVDTRGWEGRGISFLPAINADGRYVGYFSEATNLVANDSNDQGDIFVRDRLINANRSADLSVMQIDFPDTVVKGQAFTYTVRVRNAGPDAASNVALTDILPAKASLVSITASQGVCSRGQMAVCRIGSLTAGQGATINLRVRANNAGKLLNQAHVHASPKDSSPDNNRSAAVTVAGKSAHAFRGFHELD